MSLVDSDRPDDVRGRGLDLAFIAARVLAVSGLVLSGAVALLLTATVLQLRAVDPLNAPTLIRLRDAALRHPDSPEFAEDLRAMDWLARRAYFTSQRQIQVGMRLLAGALVVTLLAAHAQAHLRPRLPHPGKYRPAPGFDQAQGPVRRAVAAAGAILAAAALILAYRVPSLSLGDAGSPEAAGPSGRPPPRVSVEPPASRPSVAPQRVWPGFRGPRGNGIAAATRIPLRWDGTTGAGIRWKAAVARPGASSPVVWDDRVWLTGADAQAREVYCWRVEDGALLWTASIRDVPGSPPDLPEVSEDTGWAAPTPATDGERLYAIFANGDLVALDRDGRTAWARNLGRPHNHYGHASSLLVYDKVLVVQYDQSEGGFVAGFETATGREVWRRDRPTISWASPIAVRHDDRVELILADSRAVRSYDPATGHELWDVECLSGEVAPSPAYHSGMVFVANEYAVACGLRIGADSAEKVWEYREVLPAVASPLATGARVFFAGSDGRLACVNANDGTEHWQHEFPAGFYASPLLSGDRVYALDLDGTMHVVRDHDALELMANSPLGEPAVATPALVENRIFIRGRTHLFCIEDSAAASPEAP